MDRRNFLKFTSAGLTTGVFKGTLHGFPVSETRNLKKIGFIAGIVGKEMQKDWKSTLKKAVEFGFTELETASTYGETPADFLKICKIIGIRPFAGGTSLEPLMKEPNRYFDLYNELNYEYLVIYWPWMTGGPFKLDDCKKSADLLTKLGEKTRMNGLTLCWHNHDKEFHEMEEGLPFDYLMDHTDPNLVKSELDIYWAKKGGSDPLLILKKYPGRISILHIKDMARGPARDFECPGSGIIDFSSIFSEACDQNIDHYIVERDNCPDGLACLKSGGQYLKSLLF